MSITNLGKRIHYLERHSPSKWVDGDFVEGGVKIVPIKANIQPSTLSYRTQLLPSGDRDREAIAIYSNHWVNVSSKGSNPTPPDVILYRGARWEVVVTKPYGNFGRHCEALALKLDESQTRRDEGYMSQVN